MNQWPSRVSTCVLLMVACSTGSAGGDDPGDGSVDPDGKIAGGQSGTDGSGSYYCDLEDATLTELAIDESVNPADGLVTPCSAVEAVERLQRVRAFDCGALGEIDLDLGPATGAQRMTGTGDGESSDAESTQPCYGLAVEASIHVSSADGAIDFESAGFTTDHICWNYQLDGMTTTADGAAVSFAMEAGTYSALLVRVEGGEGEYCREKRIGGAMPVIPMPTPVGGAGGEGGWSGAQPLEGGSGGAL